MDGLNLHSPAKINLFLAVCHLRKDGYHELRSVMAPLEFGDSLWVGKRQTGNSDILEAFGLQVPKGESNLILKAASAFRSYLPDTGPFHFRLEKRIPLQSGLGGGSSNAATALRAMQRLSGDRLDECQLRGIAAEVGSDCPFFLIENAARIEGRGDQVKNLPGSALGRLTERRILLFMPSFGIDTRWAFERLRSSGGYFPQEKADFFLDEWLGGDRPAEDLLYNSFEAVAAGKFLAIPSLMNRIRRRFSSACLLSGSGSACFALLKDGQNIPEMMREIRDAFGEDAFVVETTLAAS